ncbi:sn-glycerol-1-phosphate dehydrogenase [Mobilitalea sibirica]|uniref:sn-glycerol-1-phosphate dehydrogenase n=1 Tax=Mobilitalea sibirica TaxID=1462919 RepID=A0A8J7HD84_9FIRM|nr:sn-glycerol-1-phosphate dehydrogenase [Mobilitalea sibirica]MBH1941767.1 sn-glycerol-1-phosphate dehydrogenase [Mobilitalea sibirica]
MKIKDYLNKNFSCSCTREHSVSIEHIIIETDALLSLTNIFTQAACQKAFILYDKSTYSIAGHLIEDHFQANNISFINCIINKDHPIPDEKTIGEIFIQFDSSCDMIIGVGSGTINDLSRYISYKLQLPYIIVATAPSMDGYASSVTPLIVNHMKTTFEAHAPYAILGDVNLLKESPIEMICAGIGDILGKYTSLCDWKISSLINDEYYCDTIVNMVGHTLEIIMNQIHLVKDRDPIVIKTIMEALVLSGIAMSYAGNSRPASGSEHHISHYWEMASLLRNKQPALHGTQVGVATVAVIKAYELLMNRNIDFEQSINDALHYSQIQWEDKIKETYFDAAYSVIDLEKKIGKNTPDKVTSRLKITEQNWELLKKATNSLPYSETIRNILIALNASANPISIGIDKETFINSFLVAKELRNRYGLLQLLFDLNLCEDIANEVWDYFQ